MKGINFFAVLEWVYRGMAVTFGIIVMLAIMSPVVRHVLIACGLAR